MATLHVLKVFVGEDGAGGNPLGVFLEGGEVPEDKRQGVAADLGLSETVSVEDPGRGALRIVTPGTELPFAGHPLVGTAWLLAEEGFEAPVLRPPAGEVPVRTEGDGGARHQAGCPAGAQDHDPAGQGIPDPGRASTRRNSGDQRWHRAG